MLERVSERIRRIAAVMSRTSWEEQSESPYQSVNIYQLQTDPSAPGQEVSPGPLSVYNDPDFRSDNDSDRIKRKEDVRRQGPQPQPSDRLDYRLTPTQVTVIEEPKTDEQGQSRDFVKARGMGPAWEELNRETWRSEGPGGQLVQ
jgi:hypothetical protein